MSKEEIHIPAEHEDLVEKDYLCAPVEFSTGITGGTQSGSSLDEFFANNTPKKVDKDKNTVNIEIHERKRSNDTGLF